MRQISVIGLSLLALLQPSCIIAGGYSSRDGWFFWPGGLGILLLVVIVLLLLRRRR